MVTLFHHKHETDIPTPKACTSNAHYWVVTDGDAQRSVCGPHLHMMLGQFLIEHPHIAGEYPEPGTSCEYVEVSR
jgi:hypothetical protein